MRPRPAVCACGAACRVASFVDLRPPPPCVAPFVQCAARCTRNIYLVRYAVYVSTPEDVDSRLHAYVGGLRRRVPARGRGAVLCVLAAPARTYSGTTHACPHPLRKDRDRPMRRAALHLVVAVSAASGTLPRREGRFSARGVRSLPWANR